MEASVGRAVFSNQSQSFSEASALFTVFGKASCRYSVTFTFSFSLAFEAYCAIHDRQSQEDFVAAEEIAKQLAKDTKKEFNDEPILYKTGYDK